jgi:hypothetical protein
MNEAGRIGRIDFARRPRESARKTALFPDANAMDFLPASPGEIADQNVS